MLDGLEGDSRNEKPRCCRLLDHTRIKTTSSLQRHSLRRIRNSEPALAHEKTDLAVTDHPKNLPH